MGPPDDVDPLAPGVEPLAIRPAAAALTRGLGWVMNDRSARDRDDHLLTST